MNIVTERGTFAALTFGDRAVASEAVVLLHGFPDTPCSLARFAQLLAGQGFWVVAPYLRGYAPSPITGDFSLEGLSRDILAIIHSVRLSDVAQRNAFASSRIHLIGHDWGAVLGYCFAAQWPNELASLTTVSVPHPLAFLRHIVGRQAIASWYMLLAQTRLGERTFATRDFALIDRLWRTWSPGIDLTLQRSDELKRCLAASWPAPLRYYQRMVSPLGDALARLRGPLARRIAVPTLYLHGSNDGCILARRYAMQPYFTSQLREEVLEQAGHFLLQEQPELCVELIATHLAKRVARLT